MPPQKPVRLKAWPHRARQKHFGIVQNRTQHRSANANAFGVATTVEMHRWKNTAPQNALGVARPLFSENH